VKLQYLILGGASVAPTS